MFFGCTDQSLVFIDGWKSVTYEIFSNKLIILSSTSNNIIQGSKGNKQLVTCKNKEITHLPLTKIQEKWPRQYYISKSAGDPLFVLFRVIKSLELSFKVLLRKVIV